MAQTTTETDPGSTAGQAKEQVQQQAEQAKQQVQQAGGQAKDKLREQVEQRSTQAGERVGSTAQDVRSVAEELRKQGKDQPAKLAEQAADRVERVGGYLKESDADRILRDVEDFGRQKPWAVALAGVALGFAASRFLKASSTQRYEQLRSDPTSTPRRPLAAETPTAETAPLQVATPPVPRPAHT
jgi:hypothetical protein